MKSDKLRKYIPGIRQFKIQLLDLKYSLGTSTVTRGKKTSLTIDVLKTQYDGLQTNFTVF